MCIVQSLEECLSHARYISYLFLQRPTQANIKEKTGVIERISRHSQNQRETGSKVGTKGISDAKEQKSAAKKPCPG